MDNDFDAELFKAQDVNPAIDCSRTPNIIDGCPAMKRLMIALTYYHKWDPIRDENDRVIFTSFMVIIYNRQFLNDYDHLIYHHSKELQEIYKVSLVKSEYNLKKTCSETISPDQKCRQTGAILYL